MRGVSILKHHSTIFFFANYTARPRVPFVFVNELVTGRSCIFNTIPWHSPLSHLFSCDFRDVCYIYRNTGGFAPLKKLYYIFKILQLHDIGFFHTKKYSRSFFKITHFLATESETIHFCTFCVSVLLKVSCL